MQKEQEAKKQNSIRKRQRMEWLTYEDLQGYPHFVIKETEWQKMTAKERQAATSRALFRDTLPERDRWLVTAPKAVR